jgi:hypothetical protein
MKAQQSLKCQDPLTQVTSQKTWILINTTVGTLNFACVSVCLKELLSVSKYFVLLVLFTVLPFLTAGVTPMVQDAKAVAINTQDTVAVSRWRDSNRAVSFRYTLTTVSISFFQNQNYDVHHMRHRCVSYMPCVLMGTLRSLYSRSMETHFTTKHQQKVL